MAVDEQREGARSEAGASRSSVLAWVLLAAWALAVIVAFLGVNVVFDDPANAGDRFAGLWPPDHPYWFNPLISVGAIVAASIPGIAAARKFGWRTRPGSAAIAFALGVVLWCVGNLVWFWYNTCTSWAAFSCATATEAPYPSGADVGFLLLLPCWAFGSIQFARVLAIGWREVLRMIWLPILTFAVTAWLMLPEFDVLGMTVPNRSLLFDDGYSTSQTVFSLGYLLSDALLLSLALINLTRARDAAGGVFFRPVLGFAAALVLQYTADLFFDTRVANGTEFAGDIADFLYFWAMFAAAVSLVMLGRAHTRMQRQFELLMQGSGDGSAA